MGLLTGLALSCWFGFGASVYKPYNAELPRSVEMCHDASGGHALKFNMTPYAVSEESFLRNVTSPFSVLSATVRPYSPHTKYVCVLRNMSDISNNFNVVLCSLIL